MSRLSILRLILTCSEHTQLVSFLTLVQLHSTAFFFKKKITNIHNFLRKLTKLCCFGCLGISPKLTKLCYTKLGCLPVRLNNITEKCLKKQHNLMLTSLFNPVAFRLNQEFQILFICILNKHAGQINLI